MKILLTGADGQLAQEIIKNKPKGIDLIGTTRSILDLYNLNDCFKFVIDNKPDWIINCGAYTNVEKADSEEEIAMKINAYAPMSFSKALLETGGKLLQISTDFVFNGKQSIPYSTKAKKSPINIYGKTKAKGEDFIEEIFDGKDQAIILRTSWLIGQSGNNFLTKIINLIKEKDEINVVFDQIGGPTLTNSLANACWNIIFFSDVIFRSKKVGVPILHFSDCGCASWYDLAVAIKNQCSHIRMIDKEINIRPISYKDFPSKVSRPNFSLLDNEDIRDLIKIPHIHWIDALKKSFN